MKRCLCLLLFFPALMSNARIVPDMQGNARVFLENKGQITDQYRQLRNDIDFSLHDAGMNLFIGAGHMHYQFTSRIAPAQQAAPAPVTRHDRQPASYAVYRLDMELVGANIQVRPEGREISAARMNFYRAPGSMTGITDVRSFRSVVYPGIYPGIDWVLYERDGRIKYDFILHEGADPAVIRIRYKGAKTAGLQDDGSLLLSTPLGNLIEEAPVAWTRDEEQPVACRFVQRGDEWGFATDSYSGVLVLDPGLKWGTYYGGSGMHGLMNGWAGVAAEKTDGNHIYITSETDSPDLIATVGAHQDTITGDNDAFLAKFDEEGDLVWATYYGGTGEDFSSSVATDIYGYVYIAGNTLSDGMATPLSHQSSLRSGFASNFYLARFDSTGKLTWATYYGRTAQDDAAYVATGPDGSVYLAATTRDTSDIATPGTHQEKVFATFSQYSTFLVRFDTAGQRLWGTYHAGYGGYTLLEGGIAIDRSGNIYLAGSTSVPEDIGTPGAHQEMRGGGSYDTYLGKFDTTGQLLWSTYFGGSGEDRIRAITIDPDDHVYIAGLTLSSDSIATPGTSRSISTGMGEFIGDYFVTRFNSDGQQVWGSYVGPVMGAFMLTGLTTDECSNVYVTGQTMGVSDIQPTPDAWMPVFTGAGLGMIGYLIRYDAYDGTIQYSTYFGEPYMTAPLNLCRDNGGSIYMVGYTTSDTGIATPGTWQTTMESPVNNMFLVKFVETGVASSFTDTAVCVDGTFSLPYTASGSFGAGNNFEVELSDSAGNFSYTNPVIIGTVAATGSGLVSCTIPAGTIPDSPYRIRMRATDPAVISSCPRNIRVRLYADEVSITVNADTLGTNNNYLTYQWYMNGDTLHGATDPVYVVTANGDYTVKVTDAGGCTDSSDVYSVTNYSVTSYDEAGKVSIYPNPAHDRVHISASVPVRITISSMDGRVVLRHADTGDISVTNLADGVYMLRIADKHGSLLKTEKLVKKSR